MKRIFFDTNILLDQLDTSRAGHEDAKELEHVIEEVGAQALCAWHSLSIVEYVGRKIFSEEDLYQVLQGIVKHFIIPKTGNEEALQAFAYLSGDYEDAMQTAAALAGKADYFVTRDQRGFSKSPLKVVSPLECVEQLKV